MNKLNIRKLVVFFSILAVLLGISSLIAYLTQNSGLWVYVLAITYMPTPAIAAIITQRIIFKEKIRDLGFGKIHIPAFVLFPIIGSLLLFTFVIAGSFIFGNLLKVPGFGYVTGDSLAAIKNLLGDVTLPANANVPPMFILITSVFFSSLIAGFTINMLFALGEEIGWRGFLLNELKPLGFFKANLVIGVIWAFWHAPVILMGYNYPSNPVLGVFAMNFVTIPLAFMFSLARIKSNSVITSAVMHGIFNAFAAITIAVAIGANIFIGTALGILGFVAFSLAALVAYMLTKKDVENWEVGK